MTTTPRVSAERMAKFEEWSAKQDTKKAKKDSEKFADKQLKAAHMEEWEGYKSSFSGS